ncbi:MAG TPA: hypothetical protein VJ741_14390 [Solirubrobacteraceae bacterium]|nr:hypothetical protein [Solirubrobacteraceae bacterium]
MRRTILLLTAVLGLAACGSSRPNTDGSTAAQSDPANASKALAFAKCMRSHGVSNFPDPTGGELNLQVQKTPNSTSVNGVEVNGPAFQSAMQACRSYLPNGGHPSAAQTAKARAQALAMSRCMRSHGVPNFPDPQFRTGPGGGLAVRIGGPGVNPNSPAFQAAQKACGGIFGGAKVTAKAPG